MIVTLLILLVSLAESTTVGIGKAFKQLSATAGHYVQFYSYSFGKKLGPMYVVTRIKDSYLNIVGHYLLCFNLAIIKSGLAKMLDSAI